MGDKNWPQIYEMIVTQLLDFLEIEGEVEIKKTPQGWTCSIESPDSALLIGRAGATLAAFEHLVRVIALRKIDQTSAHEIPSIHLDIEGYKQRQIDELIELANQAANHVRQNGQSEVLRPMNSFERRIVHTTLAEQTDLITESIGFGQNRRVVVKLK